MLQYAAHASNFTTTVLEKIETIYWQISERLYGLMKKQEKKKSRGTVP
jgi:hypothetical protein